jgi:RNA polymerase sigma-70 factor (ECF subfamily)
MDYKCLNGQALAELCAKGDSHAWGEFVRRFRLPLTRVILRVMQRWGITSTTSLDDFLQETYLALCAHNFRLLRAIASDDSVALDALLRSVAANVAHDQIRARGARKRGGSFRQLDQDISQLEELLALDQTAMIEATVRLEEIDRLLQKSAKSVVSQRGRSIFWLHFRMGMSAKAISQINSFGLTEKGVESYLYRTIDFIRSDPPRKTEPKAFGGLGSMPIPGSRR